MRAFSVLMLQTAIDVSKAAALEGVYGTLIGEEVAAQTEPFFELSTPPADEVPSTTRGSSSTVGASGTAEVERSIG